VSNLFLAPSALDELLRVDVDDWTAEVPLIKEHFGKFGDKLPEALSQELSSLEQRLAAAKR
jgi:phosphoenolpyruvate carboxykinase (GTP)